jgi:hypothetical protein
MSRIRMAVEIRNETNTTLRWAHDNLISGSWTKPWYPSRRAVIAPGEVAEWRAEGDLAVIPTSGTEGRVWYDIDGAAGQLYVHFNSPLSESQYGNTFHVTGPDGYEAAYWGGQGHEARLTIRLRPSVRRAVPHFKPSDNGLHFNNSDWSKDLPVMTLGRIWNLLRSRLGAAAGPLAIGPADDDWLPITHADQGMCGGMVFAVMDYFNMHQLPPLDTTPPNSGDDPLFQFIRDRLVDSFDIFGSGYRWLAYSSPLYPDGDEGVQQSLSLARGRSWVTYREEWPKIRDDIDAGRLSPIGLVQTNNMAIGDNHQVLAYAYRQTGQSVDLWVYDPLIPDADNLRLHFDISDTTRPVRVERVGDRWSELKTPRRIFAILHMEGYQPKVPPRGRPYDPRKGLTIIVGDPKYTVIEGTVTEAEKTPCGDTVEIGHWVVQTSGQFRAQASGYVQNGGKPKITWTIGTTTITAGTGEISVAAWGGAHRLAYRVSGNGEVLTVDAGPRESYDTEVRATATEQDGSGATTAAEEFNAIGEIDGYRPGDLAVIVRCIKNSIPIPVDWKRFEVPGREPQFDPGLWRERVLDEVSKIPEVEAESRRALERIINARLVIQRPR